LALLISRKLECNDHARALEWLQRIGYYRLSAYFIPFRNGASDEFRPGVTLDQILELYKFDGGLRLLTMQAMDRIEIAVRAVVTYELAHALIQTLLDEISPGSRWKDRLKPHLETYPAVDLAQMQIPADWKESTPWATVPSPISAP
jgi:Abi-like protein